MVPRTTVTVGSEEVEEDPQLENLPLRSFTVQYLKDNYEPHTVMTSLSCAGNRRGEFKQINKNVLGHGFAQNAIGNVIFKGVKMIDLLKDMGFDPDHIKDKHLIAESMDTDTVGNCF